MGAEEWVTIRKRISAVSGSKITESRSTFTGHSHCRLTLAFLFVVPEIYGVECGSHEKSGSKFDLICAPNWGSLTFFGEGH